MFSKVKVWEEKVIIPTYEIGKPDKNPMFLEKRVYQGSSGKVYPHPVIDKIYDKKTNKQYKAVLKFRLSIISFSRSSLNS